MAGGLPRGSRLNTIVLALQPLRERPEDIAPLAQHFLAMFAAHYGQPRKDLQSAALEALEQHDWRGNVRELEHVIERA